MGIFSQDKTTTNQTAYNQQVATSNRDLSGIQGVIGASSQNNRVDTHIFNTTLDEKALQTAAATVNNALAANTATTQSNLQGFQNALSVVSEHQQSAADLAKGDQSTLLGKVGVGSNQLIWIVVATIGGLFLLRKYGK